MAERSPSSLALRIARRSREQSGQAIVLIAGAMVVLILMSALVMSAGQLYWERRQAQEVADAAALAGATQVPCSTTNAYNTINAVITKQITGTAQTPSLTACQSSSSTPINMEAGNAPSWSQTYSNGATVKAWYPYVDINHIEVGVTMPAATPMAGLLNGISGSTVSARAVAKTNNDSFPSGFTVYAEQGLTCSGTTTINVFGSVYSGATIDKNCSIYVHAATDGQGNVEDQGNVLVNASGQQWSQGGGTCAAGSAIGNVVCADGYEISNSACPSPGITDFLGSTRIDYPCPGRPVQQITWDKFPLSHPADEPNQDPNALATIGGSACNPAGTGTYYTPLTLPGFATVIGRMALQRSGNAPYKDSSGYWHLRPGCYGWLDLSLIASADGSAPHAVIFDPGFYYFSGYFQSKDGQGSQGPKDAGGLCLNSGMQALGNDVEFEFVGNSSMSNSNCGLVPTSSTGSTFGIAGTPLTVGGVSYGPLSAPCDPKVSGSACPLPNGSSWCTSTDPACYGLLVWAPPGPVNGLTLPQVAGQFFAQGPTQAGSSTGQSALYGTVFWPGTCQWTANNASAITGQLECQNVNVQGGKVSSGVSIHYSGSGNNNLPSDSGLTE